MDPITTEGTETFEAKINRLTAEVKRDEHGKLVLPENLDEATAYALRTEVRRRDTQSSLTKAKQESTQLKAVNEELTAAWQKDAAASLPAREQDRLNELKTLDPDKWRAELTALEAKQQESFNSRVQTLQANATKRTEAAVNEEIFNEYNERYPGVLTDENLDLVPASFLRKFQAGEIAYADFLEQSVVFLQRGRRLDAGTQAPGTVDLSSVGGGRSPAESDKRSEDSDNYSNFVL